MRPDVAIDEADIGAAISTGRLPDERIVEGIVAEAHRRYANDDEGEVADYIPALAKASRRTFGICLAGVDGVLHSAGDVDASFSVQSVSKPFVFALVCQALGRETVREKIGVNSTGLPFDSVMAIELNENRTMNPLVNAGAIAATSLAPGDDAESKWRFIRDGLSRFAGRELQLDEEVYASETSTNQRNRGIAKLLEGYGRMYFDALEATDVYTRQCSLAVTAKDIAVMGATLAGGGINPLTGERVVDGSVGKGALAALATAGLYELTGDWLYEIGLPGKSGVSGGMITISPGKCGLGTYSAPLDRAGNSVRGRRVAGFLSERLGLDLFASKPAIASATRSSPPASSP